MGWDVGTSLTIAGLGLDIVGLLVISFPGLFEGGEALEDQSGTYWDGNRLCARLCSRTEGCCG